MTDKGLVRKSNQDSLFINTQHKFFAVADGMGGHRGGDIASSLVVQILNENFLRLPPDTENKVEVVRHAIEQANQLIYEKSQAEAHLNGMGTTFVGLLIDKNKAYISNVGDSRTYLINNKTIYQLSRDHSLVQEKINLGIYGREEASRDKMKNVLVRTLGFEENVKIDIFEYTISKNDIFVICSDGLYGKVYDEEILNIILATLKDPATCLLDDVDKSVQNLIDKANEYGGNDNITVIIAVAQSK